MSSLIIDVRAKCGHDIADVTRDAVTLANTMGITVTVMFNGIKLLARPGDNPAYIAYRYGEIIKPGYIGNITAVDWTR